MTSGNNYNIEILIGQSQNNPQSVILRQLISTIVKLKIE